MAILRLSVLKTIANEGGFVDNPNDPGGRTKYGITNRDIAVSPIPGVTDVSQMTADQAVSWYLTTQRPQHFANPLYAQIQSQEVCDKLFDMGVLFGVGEAVEQLQSAVGLSSDGDFGPITLARVNSYPGDTTLQVFRSNLIRRAQNRAQVHPQEAEFLKGWENRILS